MRAFPQISESGLSGERIHEVRITGFVARRFSMRAVFGGIFAGFLTIALSSSLWAQATAQVSGTVKDQSGAVLPGVDIKMTQTDTGVSRDTITNETGSYVLTNLPVGPYRLEAAL